MDAMLILAAIILGLAFLVFFLVRKPKNGPADTAQIKSEQTSKLEANKKAPKKPVKAHSQTTISHPLLFTRIKLQDGPVTAVCFSPNGQYFASCSSDRSALLFNTNQLHEKDKRHIRINTEYDYVSACCFTSDSKQLVAAFGDAKKIVTYQISAEKNAEGRHYKAVHEFETQHKAKINSMQLSSSQQFIVTCGADTEVKVWSPKGSLIESFDTKQGRNNMSIISPDSAYFAVAAWMADVRIWKILQEKKTGSFSGVKKPHIGMLKGHKSGVNSVCFNSKSTRMFTASEDGTWKAWNIDVRFELDADAEILFSVDNTYKITDKSSKTKPLPFNMISLSPNDLVVATVTGTNINLWKAGNGELIDSIDGVHGGVITGLAWSPDSALLAASCEDKAVYIYKNPLKK
jgi:WD40 repeat protein